MYFVYTHGYKSMVFNVRSTMVYSDYVTCVISCICGSDFVIHVGCTLSDVNLDSTSDDYNDHSPENQNESDTEFICEEAEQHWDVSSEDILRDFNEEGSSDTINPVQPNNGIVTQISTFLLLWTSFYGISATALNHLIKFLHYTF